MISAGALDGVKILDLTRILAGPTATQLLGDLGADVVKIENPGKGDDTRSWGPPFVPDADGNDTPESAYYLCANRNKRSVAVDLATPEGVETIRALARESDVLVENFKVGGLKKYGLDYDTLSALNPGLVYCSITGFGQDGPRASQPGYDFLAQAMGGIMSLTGDPEGEPTKVGVGIADVMCGMYATVGILAALRHRERTGEGQHIDVALFDCQLAWLINEGTNSFLSGQDPARRGNQHPNIVPYAAFPTADGHVVLTVGNDLQFQRWCAVAGVPDWVADPRFATNAARVRNRDALHALMNPLMKTRSSGDWTDALVAAGVPCGPVNSVSGAFADPQARHRGMKMRMDHPTSATGAVDLIGNPLKLSKTPVTYRRPPPTLGEHTQAVLNEARDREQT
ncbi:CaiB/BaiF CoA-transferase family protein [Fodinicurvata sp. EGI_FJ10296]|uniref:CaiB/BaiF CoA transferase family protein n=1 Tax=Fodinicurvata sp. EGI_FJ10296 TaxID=3231908 RepID=UPI0034548911